jgi:SRSO17 transposase
VIRAHDVQVVRQLLAERGDAKRSALARALCERWQWRAANGTWKLRSALEVLLGLEARGWIRLPPPSRPRFDPKANPLAIEPAEALGPEVGDLSELRPLRWQRVVSPAQGREWRGLLSRYHYLGAPRLVGASLRYLVYGRGGELLGVVGWQSAVQHLECRDRLIGWNPTQRVEGLGHLVNNVRFLVPPWVEVAHLASAILSESIEELRRDWHQQYQLRVWLAETFIDPGRFSGASYRAANWVAIGWTRGFAKRQQRFVYHGQTKEVYVYVLEPRLRQWVHADPDQPLLTHQFLLTLPPSELCPTLIRRKRMQEIQESWKPKLPPQWALSEKDLKSVARELSAFTEQFGEAFERIEVKDLCALYLQGLLSDTERKNAEAMALALDGPQRVRGLQRFMCDYPWDEAWIRRKHWELCAQELTDPDGVWSIDASEFPKKGTESVGVAPQYCGALGKTANCQSGVFVCYSSPKGHALLEARLYLPESWFDADHAERRENCRIPEEVHFQTKPQLALEILKPLWACGLFAADWVTCDASFGNNEAFLGQLPSGCRYLAEIPCTRTVWIQHAPDHPQLEKAGCPVEQLVAEKDLLHWENRKLAEGEKGPIVAAFARVRVYVHPERTAHSERWLLLRNNPDGQIKYALSNASADIPMTCLIRVSIARWPIERCFQEGKSELGLDHYEHRSWPAWHRHMRLVFLAQLFLLRLRHLYKKSTGADPLPNPTTPGVESTPSAPGAGVHCGVHRISSTPQLPSLSVPSQATPQGASPVAQSACPAQGITPATERPSADPFSIPS